MIVDGEGALATLEWHTRCRFEHAVGDAHAIGINVRVISTRRTFQEQGTLHDAWERCAAAQTTGNRVFIEAQCFGVNPADPPEESPHPRGMGIDAVPICTDEYARWRDAAFQTIRVTTTQSPQQPTSPFDPLNVPKLAATCAEVPQSVLWAEWQRILRSNCLAVPLPQADRAHSELREYRELLRTGQV